MKINPQTHFWNLKRVADVASSPQPDNIQLESKTEVEFSSLKIRLSNELRKLRSKIERLGICFQNRQKSIGLEHA